MSFTYGRNNTGPKIELEYYSTFHVDLKNFPRLKDT